MLPMDLPVVVHVDTGTSLPTLICACGNPEWFAVRPGTLSTAERYPHSNIVELRSDDGKPSQAWCEACWTKQFARRVA